MLAERDVSLYRGHHSIELSGLAPSTALGLEGSNGLDIRTVVLTYGDGQVERVETRGDSEVDIPGPARLVRSVELFYESERAPGHICFGARAGSHSVGLPLPQRERTTCR